MNRTWIWVLALVVLVPVLALAGTAIPPFERIDRNADGLIDPQEYQSAFPEPGPGAYEAIAGPEGMITREDWEDFREAHEKGERMYGPGFHDRNGHEPGPGHSGAAPS